MKKNICVQILCSLIFCGSLFSVHAQEATSDSTEVTEMAPTPPEAGTTTIQTYVIRQGDTMWDICKIVLDNPWYWPKLWSLNQYVLNPNLIYPTNRLVFSPATDTTFPKFEVVQGQEQQEGQEEAFIEDAPKKVAEPEVAPMNQLLFDETALRKGESLNVRLRSINFISKNGLKAIGKIQSSVEPKSDLAFGDNVFLVFYKDRDVKPGDKFKIVEKVKQVSDPDHESKTVGWTIRRKGVVTVTQVYKKHDQIKAIIADSDLAIHRDDEITEYDSDIKSVIPHFTDKSISGKIVEADAEQYLISNNDFVFLNIGTKDGLQPGLQLYVVRKGDGLIEEDDSRSKGMPDLPIARILVVEVEDHVSTAYVTTLELPLSVGDRVVTRVNK